MLPGWAEADEVNGLWKRPHVVGLPVCWELKTYFKPWHFYGKECGELAGEV